MTINFEVKNRFSRDVQFTAKIECEDSTNFSVKLGLSVEWAIKNNFSLEGADLTRADLRGADLTDADLRGAVLRGADLRGAVLTGAVLTDADLRGAVLTDAVLRESQLRHYKHDFWGVLLQYKDEIPSLREHIVEGKINGSVYSGECACLMGTIAHIKRCDVEDLPKDSSSYIESWFMAIKPGDTPENSLSSKKALEWLDEFVELSKKNAK